MAVNEIKPSNLGRSQIEELAEIFANRTGFIPCKTDIYKYVKSLGGKFNYTFDNLDSNGGSINVVDAHNFTINLSHATSPKRDIFTIAHELGHFVLHSKLGKIKIKAQRSADTNDAEREANSFASAFLMPKDLVKEQFKILDGNISDMAELFNVSILAMTWRCKNLKLI